MVNAEKQELRRGQPFSFSFDATDLGELQKVKVGHDNSGFSVRCCHTYVSGVVSSRFFVIDSIRAYIHLAGKLAM